MSFSFQSPPSNHETTEEEPQESISTDWQILSKYRIVATRTARTGRDICHFLCFLSALLLLLYWKRNYLHKQNKMKLHLFILQMLCRNWNRESGYVAFSFSCSHKELPEMIQNNVTSLKSTELLWLTLFVSHSLHLKQKLWKEKKLLSKLMQEKCCYYKLHV